MSGTANILKTGPRYEKKIDYFFMLGFSKTALENSKKNLIVDDL